MTRFSYSSYLSLPGLSNFRRHANRPSPMPTSSPVFRGSRRYYPPSRNMKLVNKPKKDENCVFFQKYAKFILAQGKLYEFYEGVCVYEKNPPYQRLKHTDKTNSNNDDDNNNLNYLKKKKKCECKQGERCTYKHDPEKVGVCKHWLYGNGCTRERCRLQHQSNPKVIPHCNYFVIGRCLNKKCKYTHIHVNFRAKICKQFANERYCEKGEECMFRHKWLQPGAKDTIADSSDGESKVVSKRKRNEVDDDVDVFAAGYKYIPFNISEEKLKEHEERCDRLFGDKTKRKKLRYFSDI
nr:13439_t:CDS:2 [Entrophospora candida]